MTSSRYACLLLATAFAVGACSSAEKAADKVTDKTTAAAAPTTGASSSAVPEMNGDDFITRSPTLSGSVVTLRQCSLLKAPAADGTLACRVLDKTSQQITGDNGLPVDIFFKQADLSPDAKTVVDACDSICTVQITGKLDRATDGTGYLSMTGVSLKAAG